MRPRRTSSRPRPAWSLARINLGYTRVMAPFDGRMDRHLVTPGNLVGAGKPTALANITRMDPIYAYFTMNERDLVRLVGSNGNRQVNYKETAVPVFAGIEGGEGYPYEGRLDFAATGAGPEHGHHPAARCIQKPQERNRRSRHDTGDVRAAANPHRGPRKSAPGLGAGARGRPGRPLPARRQRQGRGRTASGQGRRARQRDAGDRGRPQGRRVGRRERHPARAARRQGDTGQRGKRPPPRQHPPGNSGDQA